jgi:hypothetical protein
VTIFLVLVFIIIIIRVLFLYVVFVVSLVPRRSKMINLRGDIVMVAGGNILYGL